MIGTDPKTFRRFVREYVRGIGAGESLPGRGGRYVFDADEAEHIAAQYAAWRTSRGTSRITFGTGEDVTDA